MHDRPVAGPRRENALLVLGMHRSGTSLLTGTLEELGVHLGEVRRQSPYNLKGNRESVAIQQFHNALLAKNDASWHAPPDKQCAWGAPDMAAAEQLIEAHSRPDQPWGFKDPRTIFALDGWMELLERPRLVAVVRPQAEVARSLSLRGEVSIPEAHGAALWGRYNRELLRLVRRYRIPVLPFPGPAAERGLFFQRLDGLCRSWGLASPDQAAFYDPSLINQRDRDGQSGGATLYNALLAAGAQHC